MLCQPSSPLANRANSPLQSVAAHVGKTGVSGKLALLYGKHLGKHQFTKKLTSPDLDQAFHNNYGDLAIILRQTAFESQPQILQNTATKTKKGRKHLQFMGWANIGFPLQIHI